MRVGKSWVAELLCSHRDEVVDLRRAMRRRPPPFYPVNHTWALDLTQFESTAGTTFTLLGIIDHGSRKLLCLKALPSKCAFVLLGHLFLAMARWVPQAIRTDNESMFTSRLWRRTFAWLGVRHRRGPPRQPWRNGRIERFFGTLKPVLRSVQPFTLPSMIATLELFTRFYNEVRPHQGCGGLTPDEVWRGVTMGKVNERYATDGGEWVSAFGGLLVGRVPKRP